MPDDNSTESYRFATTRDLPFADPSVDRARFERWYPKTREGTADAFEIGLVQAGAISAGAYTAGVMSFLFEALDKWHDAKDQDRPDVPKHDTPLKIITGASAGGINGAIAAVACRYDFPYGAVAENPFYDAWVRDIDIRKLLDTSDLEDAEFLKSLLNSNPLVDIAQKLIAFDGGPVRSATRKWLQGGFRLIFTLTNLMGVPYVVRLGGGSKLHHEMFMHRDHLGYDVPFDQPFPQGAVPPDVLELPPRISGGNLEWQTLGITAVATGAFPLALEPREIWRTASDYEYRFAYFRNGDKIYADPWPPVGGYGRPNPHKFLSVDGGAMNNEPFEMARTALSGSEGKNPRQGDAANRAIVMIDPFSDVTELYEDLEPSMIKAVVRLIGAYKNQSRFKQIDLTLAEADDVYSRFLIAPSRKDENGETVRGAAAIASGGLGAFLGFFSEAYRHHDFMLGRANCRDFLKNWFVLPGDNPLIEQSYRLDPAARQPYRSAERDDHYQIIPLVDGIGDIEEPRWPKGAFTGYGEVAEEIESRIDRVYPVLRDELLKDAGNAFLRWLAKAFLGIAWKVVLRGKLIDLVRDKIDAAAAKVNGEDAPGSTPPDLPDGPDEDTDGE